MRGRTARRSLRPAAAVAAAFAGVLVLMPATAAGAQQELPAVVPTEDALSRALARGDISEAKYALERARSLFQPDRARRLFGAVDRADPRDATPILRDLAARLPLLGPRDRAVAERILARPTQRSDAIHPYRTGARRLCGTRVCFWWVGSTRDAPARTDRNRNRIPDWVETTRQVFKTVWNHQVGRLGYRKPRSDANSRHGGPNGKLDVYVADVGAQGLYGYCTTDDPGRARRRAVSAYCVVDDDFARAQFDGSATGVAALKVTAAHEFFHAVQYAYDWLEDLWLMEGSATWIEDEVYDSINDNRQYLRTSPLSPEFYDVSLDYHASDPGDVDSGFKYGAWIWWRFLSERHGPGIVRAVWRRADSNAGAPDEYSLEATTSALELRRQDFVSTFAEFAASNVVPAAAYSEGRAYPAPEPLTTTVEPAGIGRTIVPGVDHLASDMYGFVPGSLAPGSTLTLELELPEPISSPAASAVVELADGTVGRVPATQEPVTGRWTIAIPNFDTMKRVVLVLTNASTRFRCWRGSVFSCRGRPLDDDVEFAFTASVTPAPPPAPAP